MIKLLGPEKGRTLTFYLRPPDIDYVTRFANRKRLSRSDALRVILDEHKAASKRPKK